MTTAAQDLVALLEGAEFWVRTQVVLFLQFPEVMAVETGSSRRAQALLERYGIEPHAAAAAPDPGPPATFAPVAAKPPPTPPSLAVDELPELPDQLPTFDDQRDTTDESEPEIHQDHRPVPLMHEPLIDPEATEIDIDYEDEATVATRLDDLQPIPEDSMEEEIGDPPTLGDPDETEDLLRDAGATAADPIDELDPEELEELEEVDVEELEEVDVEELDIAELDPTEVAEPAAPPELDPEELAPADEDTSDDDEVEIGEDEVEFGEDEVEIGEDEVEIGEDEVEIGEDEVEIGEDEVEIGEDEVEIEEDEVEIDDDEIDIEVGDPGEDALVTMEDTADPRSDLDGLSAFGDSDFGEDEPLLSDEVVVRKDGSAEQHTPRSVESDLPPDEEETFVADLADIEKMKAKMGEDVGDDASNSEVMVPRPNATPPQTGARVAAVAPRAVAAAAVAGAGGVTAGLYGNPNVPQIRDRNAPKPQAAAIQIDQAMENANQSVGGGSILDDDELLELGSSEDYGEEEEEVEPGDGGFAVEMQEYEEEEEEEEEDDDLDLGDPEDEVPLVPVETGPDPAEVARLMKSAEDAVDEGDLEAAIDFYSDVLDMDPERAECHVKRGRLYLDYGDYSRAMSDFMLSEELEPTSPEPQVAVGDLYFARKDYNRAIEYFNQALQMDPNHAMAFCRRGISHYYRKNYRDALEDLNKAQQLDADIPNIRTYIAMAKKKAKR